MNGKPGFTRCMPVFQFGFSVSQTEKTSNDEKCTKRGPQLVLLVLLVRGSEASLERGDRRVGRCMKPPVAGTPPVAELGWGGKSQMQDSQMPGICWCKNVKDLVIKFAAPGTPAMTEKGTRDPRPELPRGGRAAALPFHPIICGTKRRCLHNVSQKIGAHHRSCFYLILKVQTCSMVCRGCFFAKGLGGSLGTRFRANRTAT